MINNVLNLIAPHHCYGCQKIGTTLCSNCKYYIKDEPFQRCIVCLEPTTDIGVCRRHRTVFEAAWCVGERDTTLEALIDAYKFDHTIDAARALGALLAETLPDMPTEPIFVPVPTIRPHVRQRGYDHTKIIATQLQRRCGGRISSLVRRAENTVQRGATKSVRIDQSRRAYRLQLSRRIASDAIYIVVDDVYTTGATVTAVADVLRRAGARHICLAVATRQNLDETS